MNKIFSQGVVGSMVVLCVALAGCASTGNESIRAESSSTIKDKIVEGKTTQAQVQSLFGAPTVTSFTDSGLEVWTYDFTKMSADAISYVPVVNWFGASSSGTKKSLVVLFDKQNVVQRYSLKEAEVSQKTGLFNR
ncbi:outer membrane protein assembly factor BamE domain-containing protein [Ferrovum myxofaciens]|jgi:outer membrane protein assembly factor BamE (lipoprotein component of BamABCDE complex)|uniref:Outer membrane protein assembly factor BamE n=1 Tax=Ferrovum myxofaciens TaxID=416213 RepID=A0A9E6MX64_9PROT|nr:outer membrane protein assembly factor BamE [Ferrovum myxofaciens]MBU6995023.1 outer membrane protein assembly factor BamE [Ferrovum myxofaciens]QKE38823.1 MAG: outer membrane protein assembly factor BamE [Ferrovum myxofaciens]QKE41410.1 MAG: outer membrane protein assembly factor BamE [Ferrovum myxofaciens]QWY74033.1 MAG: outer membrane protein assembly factor BamE [Ferrovum myxofaciens]QWY76785.1 MAG: outer membrane protein assembly factor BamE [Ferrovum myxofaciens]